MSRSRQTQISKHRPRLADAKLQARVNPDALARNLLLLRKHLKTQHQRREVWRLLQNLGNDVVVRRAVQTIRGTRSADELEAVLSAAGLDLWRETVRPLVQRFHREVNRLGADRAAAEAWPRFHMLAFAAERLNAPLHAADIRRLLKHPNARLRAIGARLAALRPQAELLDDCLPLCWERGDAHLPAAEAIGKLGDVRHAEIIWSRALAARRSGRTALLHRLLRVLGVMGAFDIQLALRIWIQDDFRDPAASAWRFGIVWSQLVEAKLASGTCTREEAVNDLRWFVNQSVADSGPDVASKDADLGVFYVAQQFVRLNCVKEAEALLKQITPRALPPLDAFPELCLPGLRDIVQRSNAPEKYAWLAAWGDPVAQTQLTDSWIYSLRAGKWPEHWELRALLDESFVLGVLRRSLQDMAPGVVRQVLGLIDGSEFAAALRVEIGGLASGHSSSVVRWKARRVLRGLALQPAAPKPAARWLRLDAAVLAGAKRPARPVQRVPAKKTAEPGILPPARIGHGHRLALEGLTLPARQATLKSILGAPLSRALERRVPLGPALEERPDVRAIHELAPPGNAIDERMAEMAQAVMAYWSDGDEGLTLDEDGVGLVATGLAADIRALDEDDVLACGAFVGEALRKRLGGHWSGFDDHYRLEIGDETLDPLAWAREASAIKDVVEATRILTAHYRDALKRLEHHRAHAVYHPDPSAALERTMQNLYAAPLDRPTVDMLAEARVLSYRLNAEEWPIVLTAMTNLLDDPTGVRAAAALVIYAPVDVFARAWALWGRQRREDSGLVDALCDAMRAAAQRDDLEAMPNWTAQPQQSRLSFLNSLRKRMPPGTWQKVLLLLLRQRAAAGDRSGVGWCLYSYKYEYPDCLELLERFCDMSVSARQTVLKATHHCTRDERTLFRPLWAEALRDPAAPVVMNALLAANLHNTRSLRMLVEGLLNDPRDGVAMGAEALLNVWRG